MESKQLGSSTESESDPPNPSSSGWVSAFLRRGWMLGKKVAITGAAITAAPVVVPPVLLFSTVGAVLSVPFGVYFASLACTDHLMRSLLPPLYPEPPQEVDYGDEGEEEEFLEAVEEPEIKQAPEEGEEGKPAEGEEVEETRIPKREVEIEEHDSNLESVDVVKSTNLSEEVDIPVAVVDATQSANGASVLLVADVIQEEESNDAVKMFDEMLVLTEETRDGVERVVIVEGKEVSTNNEVQGSSLDIVAVTAVEKEGENEVIEVASFSTEYASAVDLADDESRSSIDHFEDAKDANLTVGVVGVEMEKLAPSNGEDSYSEEKLWEQLDAMRAIVGYKAAPCTSLAEELRNLYVFTGVEPPTSLQQTFNLRELNSKLCFLKSVIGVM